MFIDGSKLTVLAAPSSGSPASFDVTVRYDASALLGWYPSAYIPYMGPVIERFAAVPVGGW